MAVNREPILKRCKSLGISPTVLGMSKETRRNPKAGKRTKLSEYGLQLKEKQKLKFIYNMLEKPFHKYFEIGKKMPGNTGENLLTCLESRLDNVVFRMALARTRREARQLVSHCHFLVNGKKVNIASYRIKEGDVISLKDKSKEGPKFKEIIEINKSRAIPSWIEYNKDEFSGKILRMPVKDDLDYEVTESLVVELYSK